MEKTDKQNRFSERRLVARLCMLLAVAAGFFTSALVRADGTLQAASLVSAGQSQVQINSAAKGLRLIKLHGSVGAAESGSGLASVSVGKSYVLGINRFDLDHETEILGWQISDSWYFGRQDGMDSGLTLVWQAQSNQFSLSKDGLRLTRRF